LITSLCQRRHGSCGLCCGIYNRRDHSRQAFSALLDRRTEALARAEKTPAGFSAAARALGRRDAAGGEPLFPSVRVCALLGWLDPSRTRVGCLGHPAVTGGSDLRDAGAYDRSICDAFLCPSHAWLAESEAELAEEACAGDPFLYGLVVTDVPFLRAALGGVADLCGAPVERRHLAAPDFRKALHRLFALKEELAPGSDGLYGAFRPAEDGEPIARTIDYERLGRRRSGYDAILLCVGADPLSGNDLDLLEAEVRRRLDACAAAFPAFTHS
jgi:hypothetical protein